jgi:Sec-independent protein secretion pathway component TatC
MVHIRDVYLRLNYTLLSFLMIFLISYIYSPQVLYFFVKYFLLLTGADYLHYISLFDIILVYLKLSLIFSFVLIVPLLIYHFMGYLVLGCFKYEYFIFKVFIFLLVIFMFNYLVILFNILIPLLFKFIIVYQDVNFSFVLKLKYEVFLNNYITFVYYLIFHIIMLLALILILIFSINININKLYLQFLIMLIILFLSPPEGIFQFMLLINSLFIIEGFNFIIKLINLFKITIRF